MTVDVDEQPEVAAKYDVSDEIDNNAGLARVTAGSKSCRLNCIIAQISALPTVVAFRAGKPVNRFGMLHPSDLSYRIKLSAEQSAY